MTVRVALSGSAGTGKTTLGLRLAEELGVPFIEEGMRKRLEGGLVMHDCGPGDFENLIEELWAEQRAQEEQHWDSGFVADRSAYDFGAFWIHYGFMADRERTERVMTSMIEEGRRYGRVLLLPWGAIDLQHDGVRSTDRWTQFRFQAIVEGLIRRFAPADQVAQPVTTAFDTRLAWALKVSRG